MKNINDNPNAKPKPSSLREDEYLKGKGAVLEELCEVGVEHGGIRGGDCRSRLDGASLQMVLSTGFCADCSVSRLLIAE